MKICRARNKNNANGRSQQCYGTNLLEVGDISGSMEAASNEYGLFPMISKGIRPLVTVVCVND